MTRTLGQPSNKVVAAREELAFMNKLALGLEFFLLWTLSFDLALS